MPDKRRDGAFSKPQIVGDAGKAVAQHVCREIWYGSVAEDLITVVREAAEGNGGVSLASRVRALNWPLTHEAG